MKFESSLVAQSMARLMGTCSDWRCPAADRVVSPYGLPSPLAIRSLIPLLGLCLVLAGCGGSSSVQDQSSPAVDDSAGVAVADGASQSDDSQSPETTGKVSFEFEVNGKTETIFVDDVADGTTLETVMRSIEEPAIKMRGSGSTAFVESIGENATTGTKGWVFHIDGEFANEGVGSIKLSPPVTVTWTYGEASELLSQ